MSADPTPNYTSDVYERRLSGSLAAARTLLARLIDLYPVSSILDVGCGRGTWLRAAMDLGIADRLGIDGDYVARDTLLIDSDEFRPADLSRELGIDRRFDLIMAVEVAERQPFERASSLIHDLTSATDVVLFSAAVPYQGGVGHVNEQWPEFWAILFREHGFGCFDPFRHAAWADPTVEPCYAQNVLLFVRMGTGLASRLAGHSAEGRALSRVHPELALRAATRCRPFALDALDDEVHDWRVLVDAYVSGSAVLPQLRTVEGRGRAEGGFPHSRTEDRPASDVVREHSELGRQVFSLQERVAIAEGGLAEEKRRRAHERARVVDEFAEVLARQLVTQNAALASSNPSTSSSASIPVAPEAFERGWKARVAVSTPNAMRRVFRRMRIAADVKYIRESGQFDADFYSRSYPDVASAGCDLIEHYVEFGVREGRQPRADFDTRSIGKLRVTEFPRNPFVLHLQRAERRRRHAASASSNGRTPVEGGLTRSSDPLRYGAKIADSSLIYPGSTLLDEPAEYEAQTKRIVDRFIHNSGESTPDALSTGFGPTDLIEAVIASRIVAPARSATAKRTTYSLITPYYNHDEYFRECARSVARLVAHDYAVTRERRVEWVIMNDDPRRTPAELESMIPAEVRSHTRIISDGANAGIAARLNEAIRASKSERLLFLDCDDLIVSTALDVLDHYISVFPHCRYMSSCMIDIDPDGEVLRRRHRNRASTCLFEDGMVFGHLVCIHRDLFDAVGPFDRRFSGCQDFEFALRAALTEPLLQIPEHLYAYRWHHGSQSVGHAVRQERITEAVRRAISRRVLAESTLGAGEERRATMTDDPRGICLIRTQGKRLELLAETLSSVAGQSVAMKACVVVHGDDDSFSMVKRFVARLELDAVVLHAPDMTRRRGYPLNVALDYVESNTAEYDFFCFLDDDDVYYPTFAERLTRALALSGADVAVATTNARGPDGRVSAMYPPLPPICLVAANFVPNNAYVVRVDALVRGHLRFREDIDYLEDWDFLLRLLDAGCRFRIHNETLSEFRLIGDGNTTERRDSEHFTHCSAVVRATGLMVANRLGPREFYRSVLEFDTHARVSITDGEREILHRTRIACGAGSEVRGR